MKISRINIKEAVKELRSDGAHDATVLGFRRVSKIYNRAIDQGLSRDAAIFACQIHIEDCIDRYEWEHGDGDHEPRGLDRYKARVQKAIDLLKEITN